MRVRRSLAVLAAGFTSALLVATPAAAAVYPPPDEGNTVVLLEGVTLGGSVAGATEVTVTDPEEAVTVEAGASVMVTLTEFDAGETVSGTVSDGTGTASFGPGTADENGDITFGPFTFAATGTYTLTFVSQGVVTSLGGGRVPVTDVHAAAGDTYVLTVDVVAPAAGEAAVPPTASLPKTGGSGLTPLWIGLGLVALGGGAYLVSRRTRAPQL